jgi:hypothetical protein
MPLSWHSFALLTQPDSSMGSSFCHLLNQLVSEEPLAPQKHRWVFHLDQLASEEPSAPHKHRCYFQSLTQSVSLSFTQSGALFHILSLLNLLVSKKPAAPQKHSGVILVLYLSFLPKTY